jgi:hypothetical protein
MTLSPGHVKVLKKIVREMVKNQPVPRSAIWKAFLRNTDSKIEKYRFERDISELIRMKELPGFEMKQGRNGGLIRSQPKERIVIKTTEHEVVGFVSPRELKKFLSTVDIINPNHKERMVT